LYEKLDKNLWYLNVTRQCFSLHALFIDAAEVL